MGAKAFWDTLPGLEKVFVGFGVAFVIWAGVGILKGKCSIEISARIRFLFKKRSKTLEKASQRTTTTALS